MPTPVLYVAGTGRSGSTVLANVLGELPGCVSVGELRYVWERGMVENRLCGCGEPFADCPFWRDVIERAFGSEPPQPRRMMAAQASVTRMRVLPRLLTARSRRAVFTGAELGPLPHSLERLYAAVAEVSGRPFVVDSSKLPSYAGLLDAQPGLDVHVVHLVRDPRAAAFSWSRKKEQPDRRVPGLMERRGAGKSLALWVVWNAALQLMWRGRGGRYRRLTYEAFVADPRAAVTSVAEMAGITFEPDSLFPAPGTVRLGVSHTVAGNPARLRHGDVRLRLDDEWRTAMPAGSRRLVKWGALPLMRAYGYRD